MNKLMCIQTLIDIGKFFVNNWLGGLIGLTLVAVILLVLWAVTKQMPNGVICTILAIIFTLGGMFVSNIFTSKNTNDFHIPTPEEEMGSLVGKLDDDWLNTNGGFTFEQIQNAKNDSECPTIEDVVLNINVQDYGSFVCFYYKDNDLYNNAVFLKTSNGLIYDGMLNTSYSFSYRLEWWHFLTLGFGRSYDLNSFKWHTEYEKRPYYNNVNYASLSLDVTSYTTCFKGFPYVNAKDAKIIASNKTVEYLADNIINNFTKFGDVELINTSNTKMTIVNTFYNYIWEQMQGVDYNKSKIVDVSNLTCVVIPEIERSNYPVSDSFKELYPNVDYYSVYNCNIAIDCTLEKGNVQKETTQNITDYIENVFGDDIVKVDKVEQGESFSNIKVTFNNKNGSDLTNLDLARHPVIFTFTNAELNKTKVLTIDSIDKLNKVNNLLLNQNQTWKYSIQSTSLIFEGYNGSVAVGSTKTYTLNFDYTYLNNKVLAKVGLNAVGTVDTTLFDLSNNPVKIILNNDINTYQFIFDSNDDLVGYQSAVVELGDYTYTILSDKLIFASESGNLTITMDDNVMLFNYALSINTSKYTFNISKDVETGFDAHLFYLDNSSYELYCNLIKNDEIDITFRYYFDNDMFELPTYSIGTNKFISRIDYVENLVGDNFKVQIILYSKNNNVYYSSNMFDLDMGIGMNYIVSITEN